MPSFFVSALVAVSLIFLLPNLAWAELSIQGAPEPLETNIRAYLSALSEEPCQLPSWRLRGHKKNIENKLRDAARALGYYQSTYRLEWQQAKCWKLNIEFKAGPRVTISDIDIVVRGAGKDDSRLTAIGENLAISVGASLNHASYEKSKQQLIRRLQGWGYWQPSWESARLTIGKKKESASIKFVINTGTSFVFDELVLPDSEVLRSDLLRRIANIPYGHSYDKEHFDDAYKRLQSTPYFENVWLQPQFQPGQSETKTSLDYQLASRYQLSAAVGYSTDQGERLSGRLDDNYFNDRGHSWRLEGLWSHDQAESSFLYRIPLEDPVDQWLDNQLSYIRESTDSYDSKTYSAGARYVERFDDRWTWFSAVNYQHDIYRLNLQEAEHSNLLIPSVGLNFLALDEVKRPTLGLRFESELLGSRDELLSDTSFLQLRLSAKTILPLGGRARLLTRGQLGTTLKDDFNELPPSIRFYTGGDTSVRGYEYNSIGSTDSSGQVQGGSHLLVGSLESDYLILENWSAAIFFDVGSAFDGLPDFKRGTGFGLRWHSPVGALRFDIADPLDDPNSDYRIHFSLGADL